MNLPEGCTLVYSVPGEAWYADVASPDNSTVDIVAAQGDGGGVAWEFMIEEQVLADGKPALEVRMMDDSWAAFRDAPELFAALTEHAPTTLKALIPVLDSVGARNVTPQER